MDLRRRARSTRSATQKPAAGWRFGHSISFSPGSVSSPSPTSAPIFRTLFGARAPRTSVTSCWKNTTSRRAPSRPSASSHPGLPAPFAIYLHAGHTARVEIDQRPFAPVCCLCPAQGRRSTIFPTRRARCTCAGEINFDPAPETGAQECHTGILSASTRYCNNIPPVNVHPGPTLYRIERNAPANRSAHADVPTK
jgi:hypothetical protein